MREMFAVRKENKMAKFLIEVELDWLEENTIDEVLQEKIMDGIERKALEHVIKGAERSMEKQLASAFEGLEKRIEKSVDEFIEDVAEKRFQNMKIPRKKDSWSSEVEYISLSEFVGQRYEEFLNRKVLDEKGREPSYSRDARLSINEYFINKYLEEELGGKVSKLIQTAREEAEKTIINTLEENLQSQLSADIISRLNIPALLENLERKGQALTEGVSIE